MAYPTSVKTFTTKTNGQTIAPAHINDLQTEVTAIEQGLLAGAAHDLLPDVSATRSIGSALTTWLSAFFSGLVTITRTVTNGRALVATLGTGAQATSSVIQAKAYSPAYELLNKDATQNWYVGLADDDAKQLYIGRGYGPGQGVAPALKFTVLDAVTFASSVAERGRAFAMGATQTRAYNAGDFSAVGGGTWTIASGDLTNFKYRLVGDTMWVSIDVALSSISGTVNELRIVIPGSFTAAESHAAVCLVHDNSVAAPVAGIVTVASANAFFSVFLINFGNWAAATDTSGFHVDFCFKVS